jgi:hypothetical protein
LFSSILGFELRALCLLSKFSTTSTTYPALLALVIFEISFHIYAQAVLDHNLPVYVFYIAEMTDAFPCLAILLVEMKSSKLSFA